MISESLGLLFSGSGILSVLVGVSVGIVVGILPGLGQGVSLLLTLPIVLSFPPEVALTVYAAVLGATTFGGSVTSCVLGIPGTAQNLTTVFDGYPMSREGQAGRAIGLAAFSSMLGALIGMIVVMAFIPFIKVMIYLYGSREYFLTIILAAIVVSLVNADFFKGLVAFCVGSLIAMIGSDAVFATTRYTGGIFYLWGKIPIPVFIIGLFAMSGLVMLQSDGETIARGGILRAKFKDTLRSFLEVVKNWRAVIRSSIVGLVVGIVPGVGGEVAQFISYGMQKGLSKDKSKFGKGEPKGLIASEASNSAKDSGALLPTICLGIPGSPEMAILLGILMIIGINPGPGMITENAALLWLILLASIAGNMLAGVVCIFGSPWLSRITTIPINIVFAVTLPLAFAAAYSWSNNVWDCAMIFAFCLLGIVLNRNKYPVSSLILGFVLGPLAENSFHTTLQSGFGNPAVFLTGGLAKGLFVICIILCLYPLFSRIRKSRKAGGVSGVTDNEPKNAEEETRSGVLERVGFISTLLLVGILFMLVAPKYNLQRSGLFPFILSIAMVLSSLCVLINEVRKIKKEKRENITYKRAVKWSHYFIALFVLLAYTVLVVLTGMYLGALISFILYFRFVAKKKLWVSLLWGIAIVAAITLLFNVIFRLHLWTGSIPLIIPDFLGGGRLRPFF
ncbi:MAG: tripartite tricarboxylate transporter permease [Treponema sp.]|jgi:putative tricarboxylic transport membrane protein|nr:tripartite tricarboxylate transporter permease [Treponema sp.]